MITEHCDLRMGSLVLLDFRDRGFQNSESELSSGFRTWGLEPFPAADGKQVQHHLRFKARGAYPRAAAQGRCRVNHETAALADCREQPVPTPAPCTQSPLRPSNPEAKVVGLAL